MRKRVALPATHVLTSHNCHEEHDKQGTALVMVVCCIQTVDVTDKGKTHCAHVREREQPAAGWCDAKLQF